MYKLVNSSARNYTKSKAKLIKNKDFTLQTKLQCHKINLCNKQTSVIYEKTLFLNHENRNTATSGFDSARKENIDASTELISDRLKL